MKETPPEPPQPQATDPDQPAGEPSPAPVPHEGSPDDADDVLTVPEAAAILRVHPSTLYGAIARKEVPAFKVGRCLRLSRRVVAGLVACRPPT